ncbi:MBOAT family O-acyltransferase [Almyronema epifaneia]|uniref:MBOAT family O-acyltransferase n=1 Tax=Almyronema epifaneia S1 TaxID=2991925 RepID=A0ABW6IIU1_9CYAN
MTLPSIIYALFLFSVVGIYWSLPRPILRTWLLLVASFVFYASLQVQYLPLMLAIALASYWFGKAISAPLNWRISNEAWQAAEAEWDHRRLGLLWLGIGLNVLLLFGFKYLTPSFDLLTTLTGGYPLLVASQSLLENLIIPLGISFFCFECIAYLVDVYRGSPPSDRFVEFAAYKLFFPKLISGPIVRFHSFIGQLRQPQFPQMHQVIEGLWLIAIGTVKKLLLADRIAILVNLSFDNLERAGSGDIWLATFAYGLQLYLDFSGYVDIARGSAIFLGFSLPQNFDFPYFSTSIAEFWRRWHITLGAWLRNYLYFPLGGSRKGLWRTCFNLVIVMVLAGAWHGDNWGFLIWGGIHGLALAIHRLNQAMTQRWQWLAVGWRSLPGLLLGWLLTQFVVFGSWLFFRLPDVRDFSFAVQRLWGQPADIQFATKVYRESLGLTMPEVAALLVLVGVAMAIAYVCHRRLKIQLGWPVKLLLVPLCFFLAWLLAPSETLPYIYFEF